jgi:hypothetical protein
MIALALDIATNTGFARGEPGREPAYGSIRFGKPGASHDAIFGHALDWLIAETAADRRPDVIVYEAPIPGHSKWGQTNTNSLEILNGLIAVTRAVAFMRSIFDVRSYTVGEVRKYFIGAGGARMKGKDAKPLIMRKCRLLRWEPRNDNEGDALALWSYACALIDPRTGVRVTPLFSQRGAA